MPTLTDPNSCVSPDRLKKLNRKVEAALMTMSRATRNGGNPFLFCFIGTKPHILATKIENFHLPEFNTAATDGKVFFWNPDFLEQLKPKSVINIMNHEALHVVLKHVERSIGKEPVVWNIAIDYVVNSIIEHDHKVLKKRPPWPMAEFGNNITLDKYLKFLEGKYRIPDNEKGSVYTDIECYGMSVNDIYKKILNRWEKAPEKIKKKLKEGDLPGSMDAHVPSDLEGEELAEELVRASQAAEAMEPGSTPAHVKDFVDKLFQPKIDFLEEVRFAIYNKIENDGIQNNWKRPRRRGVAQELYQPSLFDHLPRWLCLLDTSASVSKEEISYGVSQLKSLEGTEGYIVPCDAKVHWESITHISESSELDKVEVKGGGGTMFRDFFNNYEERLGSEFDVIIVITDGQVSIPPTFEPPCQVLWTLTREQKFRPPFGRVIKLRS